ncbi:MAG: twin-arginine translocase TatA/TatE family subunit [Marinilabiliales bacterium]|nr:MAG: twin-arginine translocase TatA/TatE family subunit [Marinilabiliales bacterium]
MIQYAGWLGGPEIILIVIVVLLLFGGKKIPELAKGLGKGIKEFRSATEDSDLAKDIKDVASEVNNLKKDAEKLDPRNITKSSASKK